MKTFFLAFDFKDLGDPVMVKYQAEKDLRDRILSDLITLVSTRTSKADKRDISKVLDELGVSWEFVDYSVIAVE